MTTIEPTPSVAPPEPADDRGLRPPQFTLRGLMLGTALAGGLCALFAAVGTLWSMVILLVLVLVSAHVLGNSIGTRLRDGATLRGADVEGPRPARVSVPREVRGSNPSRLAGRARLHWITLVMALSGATAGGYFGGPLLIDEYSEATTGALVLAYASTAVLGGFAGFAVSSFLAVMRQALSEAHRAARPQTVAPQPGPTQNPH